MQFQITTRIWALGIVALFTATPLQAELTVVSTFPSNGAVSVNTVTTGEVVFNQPIDTTAQYEIMNGFYLGMMLYPPGGDPDSITISSDLKTVRMYNLHLTPNTRYVFALLDAKSLSGEHLKKPVVITFTTGPSLPTGRIEGNVTIPSGNPEGTLVCVFTTLFSDELPIALGVVDATGHYTISYVPGGTGLPRFRISTTLGILTMSQKSIQWDSTMPMETALQINSYWQREKPKPMSMSP